MASLGRYLRWTFLSVLSGILAGLAAAFFLWTLQWATQTRIANLQIIWLLPVAGLFIGWVYLRFGRDVSAGHNLILEEIHNPKKVVPVRMAPLIWAATIITHLFGGSAGREGTAVQLGASLSDQLSHFFKVRNGERRILLAAGAGAGFGAAIGAPWAGVIFGMEVIQVGRLRFFAWFECLVASMAAHYTTLLLRTPHTHYPTFEIPALAWKASVWVVAAGVLFGLASRIFSALTHVVESLQKRFVDYPPLRPAIAGLLLVLLYAWEGSYRFTGLGLPIIQDALVSRSNFLDPSYKAFFTALTVGSGFKGGEFIPLVFIGTTLGSAFGAFIPLSFKLLAGLGFAAVFAGAANTPLACTLMACEIFGFSLFPYAFLACYASYFASGHSGIYKSQRIIMKKHHRLMSVLGWFGEIPRRFFE